MRANTNKNKFPGVPRGLKIRFLNHVSIIATAIIIVIFQSRACDGRLVEKSVMHD